MKDKQIEELYERGRFYRVYQIAKELKKEAEESKQVADSLEDNNQMLREEIRKLKEGIRNIEDIDNYLETGTVEGWAEDTRRKISKLKKSI